MAQTPTGHIVVGGNYRKKETKGSAGFFVWHVPERGTTSDPELYPVPQNIIDKVPEKHLKLDKTLAYILRKFSVTDEGQIALSMEAYSHDTYNQQVTWYWGPSIVLLLDEN